MDSSLQSMHLTESEKQAQLVHDEHEDGQHIHLPNPSLWPLVLTVAITVTVIGLLFVPQTPWLAILGAPFILVGIMGWALEDPMAPIKPKLSEKTSFISSDYQLGSDVVDKNGQPVGTLQARFQKYVLVEKSDDLVAQAIYIPSYLVKVQNEELVRLDLSLQDLLEQDYTAVPEDLYTSGTPDILPNVDGTPQFGNEPLSPAVTGHYNYGALSPGLNTDAANSYPRQDVVVYPQSVVSARKKKYADS